MVPEKKLPNFAFQFKMFVRVHYAFTLRGRKKEISIPYLNNIIYQVTSR